MNYTEVIEHVCNKHSINEALIMSRVRTKYVCSIRHELMYKLKAVGYNLSEIGNILDRDHTTVLNGLKKHLNKNNKTKQIPKPQYCTQFENKLRKANMPKGSITDMMRNQLSSEVLTHSINKSVSGDYESLSEYFADIITDHYFKEKNNEQR